MEWHANIRTGVRTPALAGAVALLVGFGGFGGWAAFAPLEGAVIAPGMVAVSGRNKLIQHLEGGIVKEILVREGDRVVAGAPVLTLDPTAVEAMRNRLKVQLRTLEAQEARSVAERDGARELAFPQSLSAEVGDPEIVQVVEDQVAEFRARRDRHEAELDILGQKIAAKREEIGGLEAQKQAVEQQLELILEENADADALLEKGLARKPKVLELRRAGANLKGQKGRLEASLGEAKEAIAETRQQIQRLKITRSETAVAKLAEVRLQRSDVIERLRTAQDALNRIVLRAPVSGKVISLAVHNAGAVIGAGREIMEIVPESVELIVESRVRPQDVDEVRVGQAAWLRFAAFDRRDTPLVPGEIVHVSADRLRDERRGEDYYLARLRIDSDTVTGFDVSRVGAGQPVEVFITTGERTFLSYVAKPFTTALRRGMREN